MTMAKFTVLLAMIAAYAAVDFAVPVEATDFSDGNKFESADTPSALPDADDADDIVQPLPTNITVEAAEERVEMSPGSFEHLLSFIKKWPLMPNTVHSSGNLKEATLVEKRGAPAVDVELLARLLKRTEQDAEVKLSQENINALVELLKSRIQGKSNIPEVPGMPTGRLNPDLWDKVWLLENHAAPNPEVSEFVHAVKTKLAFDIPVDPPTSTSMFNQESLAHEMTHDGKRLTLSIPVLRAKRDKEFVHQYFYDHEHEKLALEKWLGGNVLSKSDGAKHVAGQPTDVANKFAYFFALNLRDMHIRQSFPGWFNLRMSPEKVGIELENEFYLQPLAKEYYKEAYEDFCSFLSTYMWERYIKETLPI